MLNEPDLLARFAKYKGKYRNLNFFKSLPQAFGTAALRIKNRKLIKRCLFYELQLHVPPALEAVHKVSGIWFFKFNAAVATDKDVQTVKASLLRAVNKLLSDASFAAQVAQVTEAQNKDRRMAKLLLRDVKAENTLGATRVPGYYPKLPFAPNR